MRLRLRLRYGYGDDCTSTVRNLITGYNLGGVVNYVLEPTPAGHLFVQARVSK